MKCVFALLLILTASCDTRIELTAENETVKRFIDKSICTKEDMFLYQWGHGHISYFDQQEYTLNLPLYASKEMVMKDYFNGALKARYGGHVESVSLIPKKAVLEVKRIFYYHTPLCCKGYLIMATLNGKNVNGKLIEISNLFHRMPLESESQYGGAIDIGGAQLIGKYAALCSDPDP